MSETSNSQKLAAYLKHKRLKSTRQRDHITDAFFKLEGKHITIEEMLKLARRKNPSIGYATVYRTLMLLVEAGVAHQRHFEDGQSRFEAVTDHHHDHLICTKCRIIIEFENDEIEKLQETVARSNGFKLTGHKMELYGTCKTCQNSSDTRA